MNYVFDLIIIAIIALSAYLGKKEGIIKAIFGFFSTFVSFVLAIVLAKPFSDFISEKFVFSSVLNKVEEALPPEISSSDIDTLFTDNKFFNFLSKFGVSSEDVSRLIQEKAEALSVRDVVVNYIAGFVASIISIIIAFFVLFIIIKVILFILSKALNLVSKLPIIRQSNNFLGLLFGILRGLIIAIVVSRILVSATPLLKLSDSSALSSFDADKTVIIKQLDNINLFKGLMNFELK